jgi:ABC-type branched-subunit amino acid transport system substrate-binding protein
MGIKTIPYMHSQSNLKAFLGLLLCTIIMIGFICCAPKSALLAQKLNSYQIVSLLIQDEAYNEALSNLEGDYTPTADLFRAKIYYRQDKLIEAENSLLKIRAYELTNEAKPVFYRLQMYVSIRQKKFSVALTAVERLVQIKNLMSQNEQAQIQEIYSTLLQKIPIKQRASLVLNISSDVIAADLLKSSIHLVDIKTLNDCKNAYLNRANFNSEIIAQISNQTADTVRYISNMLRFKVDPLHGLDHNLLLALPLFEKESAEYEIVSGLYNGMLLEVEKYNAINANNPIHFSLLNTLDRANFLKEWRTLLQKTPPEAVIGPLFSENLSLVSSIPNPSNTPVFAPLANTVNLAESHSWIYQLNPTFENRGREAARFLIANFDSTQIDSILIIAEQGSLGERAANAFKEEILKDSLFISNYLVEDFAASAYDLRPYSNYFTTDSTLIDSLSINTFKAVYAPFSGATSETMINFLLTGLESNNNFPLIVGSGEWENYELSGLQALRYQIWFDTFQLKGDTSPKFNAFLLAYENRFGTAPNQQAILGYDMATFFIDGIQKYGSIDRFIHLFPYISEFNGLSINLDFTEQRANKSLHYLKRY